MTLAVRALKMPPKEWMIREINPDYVAALQEVISRNPEHATFTEPLAVIVNVEKEEFQQSLVPTYTFRVVGGLHRITAQKALLGNDEYKHDSRLQQRKCAVYSSSMSLDAILRLANLHNLVNALTRKASLTDHAHKCRQLLFAHFADEGATDDGQYMPAVPKCNTNRYKKYKQQCVAHIVGPAVVSIIWYHPRLALSA